MKTKEINRDIVCIVVTNLIVHFMMPFIEGAWWDDWKFYVNEYSLIREHYIEAGRVLAYYMIGLVEFLPTWMFRMIVVLCFLISAVLIYYILLGIGVKQEGALSIAILYNAIPVNDVRLMVCVFPYTLSLLLFWLATYLFVLWMKKEKTHIGMRLLILGLYFVSFSTQSLLFYYTIPLMLLVINIVITMKQSEGLQIGKLTRKVLLYMDFFCIPIVFYAVKKIFFTPYGIYKGYNSLSINRIVGAVLILPRAGLKVAQGIIHNWLQVFLDDKKIIICYIVVFLVSYFIWNKNKKRRMGKKESFIGICMGIAIYIIGIFPYVVIRGGEFTTTGLAGRDALLAGLGCGIAIYYFFKFISIPNWMNYACIACIVVTGSVHFNSWYVAYLRDYYEQLALQQSWLETNEIEEGNTFIYLFSRETDKNIRGERCYSLNALAKKTFGNSSRLILAELNELELLVDEGADKLESYVRDVTFCMDEYECDNLRIDGIMVAEYHLTTEDTIGFMLKRFRNQDEFLKELKGYIEYRYINVEHELSEKILEKYINGNEAEVEKLLETIL